MAATNAEVSVILNLKIDCVNLQTSQSELSLKTVGFSTIANYNNIQPICYTVVSFE